jgi:hypothetical protein
LKELGGTVPNKLQYPAPNYPPNIIPAPPIATNANHNPRAKSRKRAIMIFEELVFF